MNKKNKHALIIANGTLPSADRIRLAARNADYIVCADGGANHARRLGITPDIILGDFDSLYASTRKYFKSVVQEKIEDQENTDLEKALEYCIKHHFSSADIVGAFGDRIDHTTGSLGCFKKFGTKIHIRFLDSVGETTRILKSLTIKTTKGEKISLIPLERCTGITTQHLLYPLHAETLELGVREGISNEATGRSVTITVKKGTLLLYRFYHDDGHRKRP